METLKALVPYSGLIQALSSVVLLLVTIVLVLITGFYARSTRRMQKLMERQVIPDIQLRNPQLVIGRSGAISMLSCLIQNRNSASGSITRPEMVFKFMHDGSEKVVYPFHIGTQKDGFPFENDKDRIEYFRRMLFLGGMQLKLTFSYDVESPLFDRIKTNIDSMSFYVRYTDNLGNTHEFRVNDVMVKEGLITVKPSSDKGTFIIEEV